MRTFNSFNELNASLQTDNAGMGMFNDTGAGGEKEHNERIYDHLDDDFVKMNPTATYKPPDSDFVLEGNIHRFSDEAIETAIREFNRVWQQIGLTPSEREKRKESVPPKTERLEAEQQFRKILERSQYLREKYQKEGIMGIIFEPPIVELFPFDPQKLTKGLQPPMPNEIKNETVTPIHNRIPTAFE